MAMLTLRKLHTSLQNVSRFNFASNGLATGGDDGVMRLWDVTAKGGKAEVTETAKAEGMLIQNIYYMLLRYEPHQLLLVLCLKMYLFFFFCVVYACRSQETNQRS